MPTRKARKSAAKAHVKAIRANTFCARCGGQPIEWHSDRHLVNSNRRIAALVALGYSIEAIDDEISRCEPLCRSCHMAVDGRLKQLRAKCPNQKGVILVGPLPCKKCGRLAKPLRRGLCNRCNHKKRAAAKRSATLSI